MPWRMASLAQHTDLGGKLPSVHLAATAGCPDWPDAGSFGSWKPAWFIAAALASAAAVFATMWLAHILPVLVISLSAVAAWKPSTGFDFVLAAHARVGGWVCRRSLTAVLAGFGGDGRHSTDRHILAVGHPE